MQEVDGESNSGFKSTRLGVLIDAKHLWSAVARYRFGIVVLERGEQERYCFLDPIEGCNKECLSCRIKKRV